ncbi:MAG: fatty acid desaturase [Janthinobacterium lividum]
MANYLDKAQRRQLAAAQSSWLWRSDWPTWLLIVAVYGAWFGAATQARRLGLPLALPALALASAWYMSLQHELLHGHPTRFACVNACLGCAPLAVWVPYGIYRRMHLAHHAASLADPQEDPESYFVSEQRWQSAGGCLRALWVVRNTFVGRLLLGPAFSIAATFNAAGRRLARRDFRDAPMWAAHLCALAGLMYWLDRVCGIPPLLFVLGVGYPALSIASIRSFQEHRAHADVTQRTVINHAAWPWRLLFLNNNFHAVHHDLPGAPWFALPGIHRRHAADYLLRTGGFVVAGYSEWLRRYAFRPAARVVYSAQPVRAFGSSATNIAQAAAGMALNGSPRS